MALEYLKQTSFLIPSGYTITNGAMTSDSRRAYFRCIARHPAADADLQHGRQRGRKQQSSTFTRSAGIGHLMRSPTMPRTCICYQTVRRSASWQTCIRIRSWGPQAGGSRSTAYPMTWTVLFEAVKGAIFLNDEIVVLMQRTTGEARLSIARFKPDGGYVPNSFTVLGTPDGVDPRGMTLAGNRVYLLDAAQLLALDRGFAYVQSENVAVSSSARCRSDGTGARYWSMLTGALISTEANKQRSYR